MNAAEDDLTAPAATRAVAAFAPQQTFKMLLKREYWEHRGGFVLGPLIAGLVTIVFTVLGVIAISIGARYMGRGLHSGFDMDLSSDPQSAGQVGDFALTSGLGMVLLVFVFVVFFYALGSLYDERKDRSILFWKSLPVSDTQVVLSKLLWALVLAPALAVGIGLAVGVVLWIIAWLSAVLNGLDGASAIFTQAHPLQLVLQILLSIPVYALWALPTVGWLMLCSAWARSVPFVWAVVIPLLACAFMTVVYLFFAIAAPDFKFPLDTFAYVIGFRGLLSIIPGGWLLSPEMGEHAKGSALQGAQALNESAIDITVSMHALATVELWVGAVIGAAMVYAAIRLRRWRDEG